MNGHSKQEVKFSTGLSSTIKFSEEFTLTILRTEEGIKRKHSVLFFIWSVAHTEKEKDICLPSE